MKPGLEYYELLGLPRSLAIPADDLQRRFYELSRQWHPDRFVRKPVAEQQEALDVSSVLNDAYRTLRDPVKRSEYLLRLEGFDAGELRSKDVPPELLEEVFEWNMAMEEGEGVDELAKKFQGLLAESDQELEGLFARYDSNPIRETLAQVRSVLNRRKYITNLVGQASGLSKV